MQEIFFPTPTPYPTSDAPPLPTLSGNHSQELAVESVQWWNQAGAIGVTDPLQIMALILIIFFGIKAIQLNLKQVE